MRQFNSNVKVNVIDNRKNGGNYKWQIEKLDVILDFFNDDFFNDYPNVKVEVIVNSKEVLPKMIVDGMSIFPDYIRYFKAFSKSKKEMVEEMNYMVEMMNNELNNNMEENNMSNEMVNNVDLFNVYVKDVLVNEYIDAVSSAEDFADAYGDDCVENQYICGAMNYEYDIRQIWADWCWENNVMNHSDAYKYYDDNRSSSCMAAPRSLSLALRRSVPVKTAPFFSAASANSTGPRSGQSEISRVGTPRQIRSKYSAYTRSPCRLSGRSPFTRTSEPSRLKASRNAALE